MTKLDVKHFLHLYLTRKRMQDEGITNPNLEVKQFTRDFVEKLSNMDLNEEVVIKEQGFYDSKGNLIAKLPIKE